jgi:hypothetical protein
MPEDKKVKKLRYHGYMDLGYSRFVNHGSMKREWIPEQREKLVALLEKKKASKGDDEKAKYMLETYAF